MVSGQIKELDIQFGKELVCSQRAWHGLENKRSTGIDPIDFRLAPSGNGWIPPEGGTFLSRAEALRSFRRLADDIHRDTPDGVYLGAKADANVAYLEILTGSRTVSYEDDMKKIAGYSPRLIPFPEVKSTRASIEREFNDQYGLPFDRGGWGKFFSVNGLSSDRVIIDIKAYERTLVSQVVKVVGVRSQPKINLVESNEEDYWVGWVRANRDSENRVSSEFRVNSNSINRERLYKGVPQKMIYHEEGGHAVQAQSFADNIEEGSINPGRGDTTVPGPEQWILEAWASSIIRLYPAVLDPLSESLKTFVRLTVELQYLTDIVYTNAQYRLLLLEERKDNVVKDLEELLPHEPRNRIELMLTSMTKNPSRMFYIPVYGDGSWYIRDTFEQLSLSARQKLIDEIHKQPMIPEQIRSLSSRLAYP